MVHKTLFPVRWTLIGIVCLGYGLGFGQISGTPENNDRFGSSVCTGDFNGDGAPDLAVGVPNEAIGTIDSAGVVNVLYASGTDGLVTAGNQLWHQNTAGVEGDCETGDLFGTTLASGDFDDDGYDDLAVGAPGEAVGQDAGAGSVNILYGSADGLTADNNKQWYQDVGDIYGISEPGDHFGASLCTGDFNDDGYDDLAIGVPDESVSNEDSAGAVHILLGSAAGLTDTGSQFWSQGSTGIEGYLEVGDRFGASLCAGDFNGDGIDDLAVGSPGESVGSQNESGSAHVIYGSESGLVSTGNKQWYQDVTNVEGDSEAGDRFGHALTAGDFDGDGYDDLAVGVPGEAIGSIQNAGAVNVLYGSESGITAADDQIWHQDIDGVNGGAETNDQFGFALCAGQFLSEQYEGLLVGIGGESLNDIQNVGAVQFFMGSADGITAENNSQWFQAASDIQDDSETDDQFGLALAVGHFTSPVLHDIVIGIPGESLDGVSQAGAVSVFLNFAVGSTVTQQFLYQGAADLTTDVETPAEAVPLAFELEQNFPNPFNPSTTIRFHLPRPDHVKIQVFDVRGHRVSTLTDERYGQGSHAVIFDGAHLPSGVYFYSIKAGSFQDRKKMILVK